ncbi:STAS domain-containing protein [Flavobacteriaceae bacterium SZ-1-7]|uniref:STAS domain-containing protein n=1 Tax=Tamlana sedimenti TaxID=3134126 RepID=UPI003126F967
MDLKITNCNNFFKIKGTLNKSNINLFQREFQNIFEKLNDITISIQDVVSMDKYGVEAIAQLHNEALVKNKRLSIVGFGCKELYDHFKADTAA